MQNFNVGDKVKVVKLDNRTWVEVRKRLGQIGTVIKPDPTDCQIEFQDGKRFFFHYCELEKIEEDFKIGEEVYVNTSIYTDEKFKIVAITEFHIVAKDKKELIYHFDRKFVSKQPINPKSDNQAEKIMNKTPEQIDSEIKDLEAKIRDLKQEKENSTFEVGDWFIALNVKHSFDYLNGNIYEVVNITNEYDTKFLVSRLVERGLNTKNNGLDIKNARKATPAEIEAHLIKLAEESGLKVGEETRTINYIVPEQRKVVKFKLYSSETKNKNSIGCSGYLEENNLKYGLAVSYNNEFCSYPFNYIVYLQSKFQPKITINGYNAEFCEGFVKFGCASFSNQMFRETKNYIDYVSKICESNKTDPKNYFTNRKVENIKLGAGIFTPTDIENIVKRLKN